MTNYRDSSKKRKIASMISAALFCLPGLVHADDERAAAELAKAMTLNLIQALVDSGSLTQASADKLIASAQAKARAQLAAPAQPDVEFKSRYSNEPAVAAPVSANGTIPAGMVTVDAATLASLNQALAEARSATAAANAAAQKALAAAGVVGVASVGTAATMHDVGTNANAVGSIPTDTAAVLAAATAAQAAADRAVAAANAATAASSATESSAQSAASSANAAYASYIASSVTTAAPVPVASSAGTVSAPVVASIGHGSTSEPGPDGKKTVHVAYIPESTKTAMRDQIKEEVLAQAKSEHWGDPGALPDWLDRVSVSGDVRFRNEFVKLNHGNTPAGVDYSDGVFTRAANIVASSFSGVQSPFDTQDNYDFWSLRARLNVDAKVSDKVSTGFTLSTGNTNQRTSTSQNLGQNFNYYSVVIDKAFIKYDPTSWLNLSAGRITNPFFSTDLLFADDLNFEGLAVTSRFNLSPTVTPYITGGWFPLRMDSPGTSTARNLGALQAGVDWAITPKTQFKFGTAIYDFINVAGTEETENAYESGVSDYVTRNEYPASFRQMGNTLFIINAPTDPNINWGLASKFKEIDVTSALDFARLDPVHVVWTSDYVKNIGFNINDIYNRTTYKLLDGKSSGYQEKILIGAPVIKERGNWNVSLAYRYLGSDAVLDAFVNPDFGLGSTNTKGTIFTANYGIDKNTWITGRYLSSSLINSMVPEHAGSTLPPTQLNVDMVQVELNARY